jgi:hypothetical protein
MIQTRDKHLCDHNRWTTSMGEGGAGMEVLIRSARIPFLLSEQCLCLEVFMFLHRTNCVWRYSDTYCDLIVSKLDIYNHWFKGNNRNSRQEVYEERNIEALFRNHCYCGKAVTIKYSECVSVVLVNQHTKHMRRIVICGLSGCTLIFHIIS